VCILILIHCLLYFFCCTDRERLRERIVAEVEKWGNGKSLLSMLNDINHAKYGDKRYLHKYATFTPVNRAYKRALLSIHPDKHMKHFKAFVRATEMFKFVNSSFVKFRKRRRG